MAGGTAKLPVAATASPRFESAMIKYCELGVMRKALHGRRIFAGVAIEN